MGFRVAPAVIGPAFIDRDRCTGIQGFALAGIGWAVGNVLVLSSISSLANWPSTYATSFKVLCDLL
jgi:hypothetical protein